MYVSTPLLSSDTPEEGIRSQHRWLWATMCLLGIELRTSGRALGALNLWAISPAPESGLLTKFHEDSYFYSFGYEMFLTPIFVFNSILFLSCFESWGNVWMFLFLNLALWFRSLSKDAPGPHLSYHDRWKDSLPSASWMEQGPVAQWQRLPSRGRALYLNLSKGKEKTEGKTKQTWLK